MIILTVTVLIAGVFAFVPVEQATTVHANTSTPLGTVSIVSLEKTLVQHDGSSNNGLYGDDATWTLTAVSDLVVLGVYHDNTPSLGAGLCTFDDHHGGTDQAIHCNDSDYRMVSMVVDGSQFLGRDLGRIIDFNDHLELREWPRSTDNLPLAAGDTIVFTFGL